MIRTPPHKVGKNWLVWDNTILQDLDVSDCNDTLKGVCLKNLSLEDCMAQCTQGCGAGYHITLPGGDTICAPLRTETQFTINPVFRLRPQSIYPQLGARGIGIRTFLNKKIFQWPPQAGNKVFYTDSLEIGTPLGSKMGESPIGDITATEGGVLIRLHPSVISAPRLEEYQPLRWGDSVIVSQEGTSLVARANGRTLQWKKTFLAINNLSLTKFRIFPEGPEKIGDVVEYNKKFILRPQEDDSMAFALNPENNFVLSPQGTPLSFIRLMDTYYCSLEGKCLRNNRPPMGEVGYRQSGCWGQCLPQGPQGTEGTEVRSWGVGYKISMIILVILIFLIVLGVGFFLQIRY